MVRQFVSFFLQQISYITFFFFLCLRSRLRTGLVVIVYYSQHYLLPHFTTIKYTQFMFTGSC